MSSPESPSTEGPPAVTELLAVCLERLSLGEPLGLDDLCAEHPGQADELRRRVDRLAALGLLDDDGAAARPSAGPEQVSDVYTDVTQSVSPIS